MSVVSYSSYFYTTVINTSNAASFSGISNIEVTWQRPITLYKPLDYAAPIKVKGKLDGKLTIDGMVVAGDDFDRIQSEASLTSAVPSQTVITVTNGSASAAYTGYPIGTGFSFRKVADRTWVMDKKLIYKLVEE
jgi:hypothetical protein